MMLDIDDSPSQEEIAAVLEHQRGRIHHWKSRSYKSGLTFGFVCGLTSLFFAGMPFHPYWDRIGKYGLLVTYAAMLWALYCSVLLWGAFSQHREFKNTYSTLENEDA